MAVSSLALGHTDAGRLPSAGRPTPVLVQSLIAAVFRRQVHFDFERVRGVSERDDRRFR
jgi:hypothetical protein